MLSGTTWVAKFCLVFVTYLLAPLQPIYKCRYSFDLFKFVPFMMEIVLTDGIFVETEVSLPSISSSDGPNGLAMATIDHGPSCHYSHMRVLAGDIIFNDPP
jgi:hypothetical protein